MEAPTVLSPATIEPSPGIAFLGLAERAAQVRDGASNLFKWNVLGLRSLLLFPFFPISLSGWKAVFSFHSSRLREPFRISIRSEKDEELGWMQGAFEMCADGEPLISSDSPTFSQYQRGWVFACFDLNSESPVLLPGPGTVSLTLETAEGRETIGCFQVVGVEPVPLTADRIAAIRTNPTAAKAARAAFSCKFCESKSKVYAALERTPKIESEGYEWYEDISETFKCACGKTSLDLSSVKRNFFAILGSDFATGESALSLIPQYERGALSNLCIDFGKLIDSNPSEEILQKFIERNPVLLHQFPAERLFFKPPILTRFRADFAIVTPQKELVLIEIERAGTRLLKKNGDQHSDLTHALGQITNWLHEADEHRLAVLDSLEIPRDMVGKIRGVVIAGRDAGNDAGHLRRLKGADLGRVTLFTYDDISAGLAALAQRIGSL